MGAGQIDKTTNRNIDSGAFLVSVHVQVSMVSGCHLDMAEVAFDRVPHELLLWKVIVLNL